MSPQDVEVALKYLVDKLDPSDRNDLDALLSGPIDSIAEDVMGGRLKVAFDAMPESLRRQIRAKTMPDHSAENEEYAKQFPLAGRLR